MVTPPALTLRSALMLSTTFAIAGMGCGIGVDLISRRVFSSNPNFIDSCFKGMVTGIALATLYQFGGPLVATGGGIASIYVFTKTYQSRPQSILDFSIILIISGLLFGGASYAFSFRFKGA